MTNDFCPLTAHLVLRVHRNIRGTVLWSHWRAAEGKAHIPVAVSTPTKTIWTSPVPPLDPLLPGGFANTHWQVVTVAGCAAVAGRHDLTGWKGTFCYCDIANPGLCPCSIRHLRSCVGLRVFYGCAYLDGRASYLTRGVAKADVQYSTAVDRVAWRFLAANPKFAVVGETLVPQAGETARDKPWCALAFACVDPGEPSDSWCVRGYGEDAAIHHKLTVGKSVSHFVVPMLNQVLENDTYTRRHASGQEVLLAAVQMLSARTTSLPAWCLRRITSGLLGLPEVFCRFFRAFENGALVQTVHWQQRSGLLFGHHATVEANAAFHFQTPPAFLDAARGFHHEVVVEATHRPDERCWLFRTLFPKHLYVKHFEHNGPISIPRGLMAKAETLWFSHRRPGARNAEEIVAHGTVRAHTSYALDLQLDAKTPYQLANLRAAQACGDPAFLAEVITLQSKVRAAAAEEHAHSTWSKRQADAAHQWFVGPAPKPTGRDPPPAVRAEYIGEVRSAPPRSSIVGCGVCGELGHVDANCPLNPKDSEPGRGPPTDWGEATIPWQDSEDALVAVCTCTCGRLAPPHRRWRRGVCPDCWAARTTRDRRGPSSIDRPAELDWIDPEHYIVEHPAIGPGFTPIPDSSVPVLLQPREPVEKAKPRRPGTVLDDSKEVPSRIDIRRAAGRAVASCPELLGVAVIRIPGVYSQSNKCVRNALSTRALASAKFAPDAPTPAEPLDSFAFLERNWARLIRLLYELIGLPDPLRGVSNSKPAVHTPEKKAWRDRFPAARRAELERAEMDAALGKGPRTAAKIGSFSFMGKAEFDGNLGFGLPVHDEQHDISVAPAVQAKGNTRGIMVPTNTAHDILGPLLWAMTTYLHKLLNAKLGWYYCAGSTPGELNAWLNGLPLQNVVDDVLQAKGKHPLDGDHSLIRQLRALHKVGKYVFVNSDFSGFDQSHSARSMHFVRTVLIRLGWPTRRDHPNHRPHPTGVTEDQVRAAWDKPRGFTSTGLRFRAATINASGRDDTALLNALNNAFVQGAAWLRASLGKGKPITWQQVESATDAQWLEQLGQFRLIILGDDSMACVPPEWQAWAPLVNKYISGFGFETKTDLQTELTSCVFLGQRPWPTTRGLRFAPTLGRRLYKMQWCQKPPIDGARWLHSTSWAMLQAYPFWVGGRALAVHGLVKTAHIKMRINPKDLKGSLGPWDIMRAKGDIAMPTERTYWALQQVYGLSRSDFDHFEEVVSQLPTTRGILRHAVLDRVSMVDQC
nr:MAG: hypothetical protein [Chemarfal virus 141]